MMRKCRQHISNDKTSVRFALTSDTLYLVLTGEIWSAFVSNTKKNGRDISRAYCTCITAVEYTLRWRHNDHDSVSNHQPHGGSLNRLFRRRSKKNQSSASLAFVWGIHRRPVNFPHKGPVTRKMFPFDEVIMIWFTAYNGWTYTEPCLPIALQLRNMRLAVSQITSNSNIWPKACPC